MSTLCIHGLGYIGLPTAAMFANYDYDVVGYDTDEELVDRLNSGDVHIDDPGLRAFVTQAIESDQLTISDEIVAAKYHIICVPTPFDSESKDVGLEYVESAGEAIVSHLRPGDTVILESTVPPGTTADVLRPTLEQSGFEAGEDFALAHCPETVLPGNIITELQQNARIVGGVNGISTEAAVRLYESFVDAEIHTTANATTAEFVKLIQNTFRDANIAIANEIAKLAHDYDIDSREAISLANEHPRVNIHQPGPGVGGHCLPVDPWFLGQNSDQLDLIKHARKINDQMTDYIIGILSDELESIVDAKIAILGVAYKDNIDDTRESPGLKLARELQTSSHHKYGTAMADGSGTMETTNPPTVSLHDPHVTDQTLQLSSLEEAVTDATAIVITTDHDCFKDIDPNAIAQEMNGNFVVDSKAILDKAEWETNGYRVRQL